MRKIKEIILVLFSMVQFLKAEKILIESVSPKFGLIAILEQTQDVTYLYLLKKEVHPMIRTITSLK